MNEEVKWESLLRYRLIEIIALWEGRLTTNHLCGTFGIKRQQASRDINNYLTLAEGNIAYDPKLKGYHPTETFTPKFTQGRVDEYLQLLDSNSLLDESVERLALPETPTYVLRAPSRITSPSIVRKLVEACRRGLRLEITYASMNNAEGEERIIAPHAIVSSGYRWHMRAYCEKNRDYRDFIIGRVLEISDFMGSRVDNPIEDQLWQEFIELRLVPHPDLSEPQKQLIERERGMTDGQLLVTTRKATAIYMLQLLQVPTEKSDNPMATPMVLENLPEIDALKFGKKTVQS
ncbi:MAG: WYL domain-containing protein [Motiliproteus sp.]